MDESRGEDTYPKPARFVFETAVDELGYVVDEMHRGVYAVCFLAPSGQNILVRRRSL